MSSFSSVVQKPGKKIVPKAAPRRNVPRRPGSTLDPTLGTSKSEETQSERPTEQSSRSSVATTAEVEAGDIEQQQTSIVETSQHSNDSVTNDAVALAALTPAVSTQEAAVEEVAVPVQEIHEQPETEEVATSEAPADAPPRILSVLPSPKVVDSRSPAAITSESIPSSTISGSRTDELLSVGRQSQEPQNTVTRSLRKRKATSRVHTLSSPTKRRRTASRAGSDLVSPQANSSVSVIQHASSGRPTHSPNDQNALPADLLQSATQRAASVSQLASNIEAQTRSLRPHRDQHSLNEPDSTAEADSLETSSFRTAKSRRSQRRKSAQEQADEVIANVVASSNSSARQRGVTPEGAETYELAPEKVTMGDLCEDNRLGKKSALETEMQANWTEIVQRRKEDRLRALENAEKRRRNGIGQKHILNEDQGPVMALAPAMTVVNGVIVVDHASREIDRAAQLQQAAVQDLDNVREDRDFYKYVHQGTIGVKPGRGQHAKWDEESTERFFKGLRMFGTDFLMIANMFPGVSRKQIKSKFIREENADKARVMECLRNREPVQLDDYAQMANKETDEFQTLESIQKELDEQERRLREEDKERRKREGFATTGDGDEGQQDTAGEVGAGNAQQPESAEPGRFDALANEVIEAAIAPKKRQRKSNTVNRRGPKNIRRPEGGIEEVLGNIHEVAV